MEVASGIGNPGTRSAGVGQGRPATWTLEWSNRKNRTRPRISTREEASGPADGAADADAGGNSGGAGARPPPPLVQLAAWYASMTDFGMRPRSLT